MLCRDTIISHKQYHHTHQLSFFLVVCQVTGQITEALGLDPEIIDLSELVTRKWRVEIAVDLLGKTLTKFL